MSHPVDPDREDPREVFEALSLEEGARETSDKLDHTLRAYGRLEKHSAEKGREIMRLRALIEDDEHRAQVVAEVVELLRADDTSSGHYAAELIERWEAKR